MLFNREKQITETDESIMSIILRIITQFTVLTALIAIAFLNHYENQKIKYGGEELIEKSSVLSIIDKTIGMRDNRHEIVTFVQGDIWAGTIGDFKITDPLSFIGNISRTGDIYLPFLYASLLPVLLTIVFGKIFCGWICPMALFGQVNVKLRRIIKRIGVPLLNINMPVLLKYVVLGSGIIMGIFFGVHFFFLIYPPKLISDEIYYIITKSTVSIGFFLIFSMLFFELIFGGRLWCRTLCPGGAVYSLLNRMRLISVKNDRRKCVSCKKCDQICPYVLTPSTGVISSECDQCALCISQCPERALSFSRRWS